MCFFSECKSKLGVHRVFVEGKKGGRGQFKVGSRQSVAGSRWSEVRNWWLVVLIKGLFEGVLFIFCKTKNLNGLALSVNFVNNYISFKNQIPNIIPVEKD